MALKRLSPKFDSNLKVKVKKAIYNLGDITVRSRINHYTYEITESITDKQSDLIKKLTKKKDIFYAFTQSVYGASIILSESEDETVQKLFKNEKLIGKIEQLSSITIKLPSGHSSTSGVYYFILKKIAWEGINVLDMISSIHEFTIIVDDESVDRAFSILKNLNKV